MATRTLVAAAAIAALTMTAVAADRPAPKADKAATSRPAGCTPWSKKNFVHPPLKCMEPYKRIVEYPVSAWCFHGVEAAKSPYAEKYVRDFKAIGFNVLIDDERILPYAEKVGGVMVQLCSARSTAKSKATFYQPAEAIDKSFFANPKIGDHPLLQGIILGDNGSSFAAREIRTAAWLKKNYPHVMPIMSMYSSRVPGNTDLRVLHVQSYPWMPGRRGYRSSTAPRRYCGRLEYDRRFVNTNDMALFECYAGDTSFTRVRYQLHVAMAYGAQGLSNFCYSPHRMRDYKPDSPMIPLWYKMHQYVIHVLGRHLWGTRSMDVLHSVHGGGHQGAQGFDAGQLVVRASEFSMVGLLTPEAKFRSKDPADRAVPEYFLFVDKRASGGKTPEARDTYMMLSTKVPVVEFIDAASTKDAKVRKLVPGFKVRMKTEGSDARLLRVAPDMKKLLGGADGLKLYDQINLTMAALQSKATPPAKKGETKAEVDLPAAPVHAKEIAWGIEVAKGKVAELKKVLAAAVKGGRISRGQADDTLRRLDKAIGATAAEAKARKAELNKK